MLEQSTIWRELNLKVFSKYLLDEDCAEFLHFLKMLRMSWKDYQELKFVRKMATCCYFRRELMYTRIRKTYEHNIQLAQQGLLTEQEIKRIKVPTKKLRMSREAKLSVYSKYLPDENCSEFRAFLKMMAHSWEEYQELCCDLKLSINCYFRMSLAYKKLQADKIQLEKLQQVLRDAAQRRVDEQIMKEVKEHEAQWLSKTDGWWMSCWGYFCAKPHLRKEV